jgi:hypothetical protein
MAVSLLTVYVALELLPLCMNWLIRLDTWNQHAYWLKSQYLNVLLSI